MIDKNTELEKHLKVIMNQFNVGNHTFVISKCKKIIKEFSEYVVLYNILGSSYQQTGELGLAKNIFEKALKMDPKNIPIMNNLANTLKHMEDFINAENLYIKILDANPKYVNSLVNYGNLKRDMNDFNESIKLYKKAIAINDNLPVVHFNLALSCQGLGDFEQAITHAKKVLSINPNFTQADKMISQSSKYTMLNEHMLSMEHKVKNNKLNPQQKFNLLFALGKAYEDTNDIKKSFDYFAEGNNIKRETLNYNINDEVLLFNNLKKVFEKINFNNFKESSVDDKKMIFILGMPRSGTTLVEQIISSHTKVYGSGELPYLSKIIKDEFLSDGLILEGNIEKNLIENPSNLRDLSAKYFSYIDRFETDKNFITDKAPLNFRWIGFIKILFPDAKIIHCSRNPHDNCLSLFKNLFEGGLNFSYNQKELGAYYNLYSDLMKFWESKVPDFFFTIKYEDIVEDIETSSKKIINFCGLDWEQECMSFYNNKSPIKTMSTAQARQPVYKTSLKSSEKFSPYMKQLNNLIS